MTIEQRKKRVQELTAKLADLMRWTSRTPRNQRMRVRAIKETIEARYRQQQIIDREEQSALAGN